MPGTYHPTIQLLAAALATAELRLDCTSRRFRERLLAAAPDHGVDALLRCRVHAGFVKGLDEQEHEALRAVSRRAAVQDLALNAATEKTLDLLAEAGIPALLLKGTALGLLYYGDTYLRTRCDTDIFIRPTDRHRTADLLSDSGYRITGLDERPHASKQFGAALLTQPGLSGTFDIHWKLSNRVVFSDALRFDECWRSRQPLPGLGNNAYTLSPARLLLHACIHRIAHGRNTQRNRLLWLFDIHLITRAFSAEDFDQFQRLAVEKRVGRLCQDALIMCQFYFGTRYPEGYLAGLARNSGGEPSAGLLQASRRRWAIADIAALRTTRARLAFAGELLFPAGGARGRGLIPRVKAWTTHLLEAVR